MNEKDLHFCEWPRIESLWDVEDRLNLYYQENNIDCVGFIAEDLKYIMYTLKPGDTSVDGRFKHIRSIKDATLLGPLTAFNTVFEYVRDGKNFGLFNIKELIEYVPGGDRLKRRSYIWQSHNVISCEVIKTGKEKEVSMENNKEILVLLQEISDKLEKRKGKSEVLSQAKEEAKGLITEATLRAVSSAVLNGDQSPLMSAIASAIAIFAGSRIDNGLLKNVISEIGVSSLQNLQAGAVEKLKAILVEKSVEK